MMAAVSWPADNKSYAVPTRIECPLNAREMNRSKLDFWADSFIKRRTTVSINPRLMALPW
jgi:hypothetical protein